MKDYEQGCSAGVAIVECRLREMGKDTHGMSIEKIYELYAQLVFAESASTSQSETPQTTQAGKIKVASNQERPWRLHDPVVVQPMNRSPHEVKYNPYMGQ